MTLCLMAWAEESREEGGTAEDPMTAHVGRVALLAKHAAGMSPAEIAAPPDHRRSERAILEHLAKLGVS